MLREKFALMFTSFLRHVVPSCVKSGSTRGGAKD